MVCTRLMPVTRMTPRLIGTSMLVRPWRSAAAGRGEERPPGVGNRRHGDQRRDPVQQIASSPGPCDRAAALPAQMPMDSSMTLPAAKPATARARIRASPGRVLGGGQGRRIERHQPIAKRLDRGRPDRVGAFGGAAPDQAQPAGRHVDAAVQHVRLRAPAPIRSARRRRRIAGRRRRVSVRACHRRVW